MRRLKSGFTLVELLVVIAIIGVLVALLLPAVQMAREASRRASCNSKLKQLGIAMQTYHDALRAFPLGAAYVGPPAASGFTDFADSNFRGTGWGATWTTMLLPYIEQTTMHSAYKFELPSGDTNNARVTQNELVVMKCPSSDTLTPANNPDGIGGIYAKGNYAVATGGKVANQNDDPNGWRGPFKAAFTFRPQLSTTMTDIKDGLSNTIILSEILGFLHDNDCRGCWGRVGGCIFSAHTLDLSDQWIATPNASAKISLNLRDCPIHCNSAAPFPPCADCSGDGDSGGNVARSWHPNGVNCTFGDGSVRFITNNVDRITWRAAISIRNSDGGL